MDFIQLAVAGAAVASVLVSAFAFIATRKHSTAELEIERRVSDISELKTMNEVLRAGLNDAQAQVNQLNGDLERARHTVTVTKDELVKLNEALNVALANVALLSDFIEQNVPLTIPRPVLRRMV